MEDKSSPVKPVIIHVGVSHMLPGEIGLLASRDIGKDMIIADAGKLGEKCLETTKTSGI